MDSPLAGLRSCTDATTCQLYLDRVSYNSFDHCLVPVIPTSAPCWFRVLIAIAYHRAPTCPLTAKELDINDIALPLEFTHSRKSIRHILEKRVNVCICVQSRPRQKEIASEPAGSFQ